MNPLQRNATIQDYVIVPLRAIGHVISEVAKLIARFVQALFDAIASIRSSNLFCSQKECRTATRDDNKKNHSDISEKPNFKNPTSPISPRCPVNPPTNESDWLQSDQSRLKQEIQKEAKEILQRKLEKRKKKQAKTTSNFSPVTAVDANANLSISTASTSAQENKVHPTMRKEISKTAMEIFNRLWQENAPIEGPWEIRSFRNDIKMTRKEALVIIVALGGSYFRERGKGSHHVAHLPKIGFNGKDVGEITSWKGKEDELITLTNGKELKHYQIKQLRNILLKQGFNPDTVFQLKVDYH